MSKPRKANNTRRLYTTPHLRTARRIVSAYRRAISPSRKK